MGQQIDAHYKEGDAGEVIQPHDYRFAPEVIQVGSRQHRDQRVRQQGDRTEHPHEEGTAGIVKDNEA